MGEKMTERELFEKWCQSEGYLLDKQGTGVYSSFPTRNAWRGWMARTNTYKPSQTVDAPAILTLAGFLRALSPDGEEWRSSNPNNPAVINIRELAEKMLTTIREPS